MALPAGRRPARLALTGILASLVGPLADARVNIFAFSTYDTDYLLVPAVRLAEAIAALTRPATASPPEPVRQIPAVARRTSRRRTCLRRVASRAGRRPAAQPPDLRPTTRASAAAGRRTDRRLRPRAPPPLPSPDRSRRPPGRARRPDRASPKRRPSTAAAVRAAGAGDRGRSGAPDWSPSSGARVVTGPLCAGTWQYTVVAGARPRAAAGGHPGRGRPRCGWSPPAPTCAASRCAPARRPASAPPPAMPPTGGRRCRLLAHARNTADPLRLPRPRGHLRRAGAADHPRRRARHPYAGPQRPRGARRRPRRRRRRGAGAAGELDRRRGRR